MKPSTPLPEERDVPLKTPAPQATVARSLAAMLEPDVGQRRATEALLQQLLEAQTGGNTAIALDADTRQWLQARRWAASNRETAPVMVDDSLAQFHSYWHAEKAIAAALVARSGASGQTRPVPALEADFIQQARQARLNEEKLVLIEKALGQSLTVLTGGPGTGKTTALAWLLAALLRQAGDLSIALAAPTGKAAQRMKESLDRAIDNLPLNAEQRQHLQQLNPGTLHRLLGIGYTPQPAFDASNPLPFDLVVVDEASMVDVQLLAKLVRALPARTRLILMGDPYQLASVEAGNVLGDLVQGLPEAHAQLTHSHRFNKAIEGLAKAVFGGQAEHAWQLLSGSGSSALAVIEASQKALLAAIDAGFSGYLQALKGVNAGVEPEKRGAVARQLMDSLKAFRVLSPLRHDRRIGVEMLNQQIISHWQRQRRLQALGQGLFCGQSILIKENDRSLDLFNGDMGVLLPHGKAVMAWFEDSRSHTGLRAIPVTQLPRWETAYAMTVHKAQGAEFENVLLVLPDEPQPVLTRELLYTALTRAQKKFMLAGHEAIFSAAVTNPLQRTGGLLPKIQAERKGQLAP